MNFDDFFVKNSFKIKITAEVFRERTQKDVDTFNNIDIFSKKLKPETI
jgi:hypothetical protein